MKIKCIINTIAGKGKAARVWRQIESMLLDNFTELQYEFTNYKGHATEIAKRAVCEEKELVMVVGGDGTLNEVINGLAGGKTALAIIPAGTGNDLAKTLKIPVNCIEAVQLLLGNSTRKLIDLGKVNQTYFVNMAGIGFDAEAAQRVNKKRFLKGNIAYLFAIIQTLLTFRPITLKMIINGEERVEEVMLVAIGNGEYVGGGIRLLPQAQINDGLLDVCIINKTTLYEALKTLPLVYAGKHLEHPNCKFYKCREILIQEIETDRKKYSQIDGQMFSQFPLEFKIIPQALEVIVPKENNLV